jgi:hypothetical protein
MDFPVRRRVAIFSLFFAWVCANGAIWDAAQVFAWGKMFAGYAQTMSVTEALRATFDPERPCELCLGVANAKETAKQQLPQAVEHSAEKLLLAIHAPARILFENSATEWPAVLASAAPNRTESVPVPPPRA